MQKALTQMNLQLHNVISDITGVSGLAIIDAILLGECEPSKLSGLCDGRIKASRQVVAKSLVGDYRPEHLFCLLLLRSRPANHPLSFLKALRLLAGTLSGQPHQWRQNPLFENPQRALPACQCLAHGRDHFISQPLWAW